MKAEDYETLLSGEEEDYAMGEDCPMPVHYRGDSTHSKLTDDLLTDAKLSSVLFAEPRPGQAQVRDMDESADSCAPEIEEVPSREMLARFLPQAPPDRLLKKPTNLPKFVFKLGMEEGRREFGSYKGQRWMDSLGKRYPMADNEQGTRRASRFALLDLLQLREGRDNEERAACKKKLRELLQRRLCQGRVDLVLANESIPSFNKVHYLYWCRVYEWRLNNQWLLNHLT